MTGKMKTYQLTYKNVNGENEFSVLKKAKSIDHLRAYICKTKILKGGSVEVLQFLKYGNIRYVGTVTKGAQGHNWYAYARKAGKITKSQINPDGSLKSNRG